jgi:hypothetical protein
MPSQILRPTRIKGQKRESPWQVQGPWGQRIFEPMSRLEFYRLLHGELVASGVLRADSSAPSTRHHAHVTMMIQRCAWIAGRWVLEEPLAVAV